jgi:hypothetical protein
MHVGKSRDGKVVAFVAHSFAARDRAVVTAIVRTIRRAKISVLSGERSEARGVSDKVKARIQMADVFVAILTHRHPLKNAQLWTTSPWVVEEKGYSLGQNPERPMVLLVEEGVSVPGETGGLEGDLEYIAFNRYQLDDARKKLREVLGWFVTSPPGRRR